MGQEPLFLDLCHLGAIYLFLIFNFQHPLRDQGPPAFQRPECIYPKNRHLLDTPRPQGPSSVALEFLATEGNDSNAEKRLGRPGVSLKPHRLAGRREIKGSFCCSSLVLWNRLRELAGWNFNSIYQACTLELAEAIFGRGSRE